MATSLHIGQTKFEQICKQQQAEGKDNFVLFASEDKWGIAQWLMKNVRQNKTEELLKLTILHANTLRK